MLKLLIKLNSAGLQFTETVVTQKRTEVHLSHFIPLAFCPYRLPYSSFVTVSGGPWGSRRWLPQLQHKPRELSLSYLPLRLNTTQPCPGIPSPRSSPPWCLSPLQQLQYPCLHLPLPLPLHSPSIISQYVPLFFHCAK